MDKNTFIDGKNTSCLSSPYLNKANDHYKHFNYNYEVNKGKQSKFMNKTEASGFNKIKVTESTKTQIRNQMIDIELIKLPSIGTEEAYVVQTENNVGNIGNSKTGKNYISNKHILHSPTEISKKSKNLSSKDCYKAYFNPMLNKTRVDNLPPLQEKASFDQSFESKRKQTCNQQQLRSRSIKISNFENGTYKSGTINEALYTQNQFEENKSSNNKHYKSPIRNKKGTGAINIPSLQEDEDQAKYQELIVDNSLNMVSNTGGSNKEVLLKSETNISNSKDNK